MAFNPIQISPDDLNSRKALGVDLPFSDDNIFRSTYQTKDAIRNNLINYMLTDPGERIGNPNFGAGIRKFVFEQITNDNLDFLKEDIQDKISLYFPLVSVQELEVLSSPDHNEISVVLSYSIINTNITDEINLSFR